MTKSFYDIVQPV